jgi:dihydrodipicolinate synthase/N-acetylneuraminate lyase
LTAQQQAAKIQTCKSASQPLPRVIGFPVSPFSDAGEFDAAAFRENIKFMLNTAWPLLCGSNGEMRSLTIDEYRELSAIAGEIVGRKKGLIFGSVRPSTARAGARA